MPKVIAQDSSRIVEEYFLQLSEKYRTGQAREHAYRPVFESLIHNLDNSLRILNDPSRSEHGNPDFVFLRKDITVGYTETKDIGVDLDKIQNSDQMKRYLGYSNLILTDYLEFRFFKNGASYGEIIRIGKVADRRLEANTKAFSLLVDELSNFLSGEPEPIKSGKRLAEIMGGKARRICDNIRHFLSVEAGRKTELMRVYETIKKQLVHDLTPEAFADMYAQTLVYGLFVARFYDESPKTFSRQEARELIPATNPLLRHFFDHIVGADFDKRLEYIVTELCAVFTLADVQTLMHEYFSKNGAVEGQDPVVHFYEDFLKEYDAELRKKLGAFYTPLPVVRFIVRAVDHILEKDFGLAAGLADTAKAGEYHRVQILDPATGTGTFLTETVKAIYSRFINQKGRWPTYVHHDLLPRLHGFELMMAPYTIAHLKLGMVFAETGFKYFNRRLEVYLTNSLEQSAVQGDMLSAFGFAQSIADEAKEATVIKTKTPIMVVIGNPPYSGESSNKHYNGNDVYKVEPDGGKLRERNSKWLNDDYVKFIRLAESFIEKNNEGIVAMITAHGYLDNPTFRGMRWHLMKTFDEICVLDLHGNANKKEKAPDGGDDQNIFDIKTGVSIFIGIKRTKKPDERPALVFRTDFYGSRQAKFNQLESSNLESIQWKTISPVTPNYEWVARDIKTRSQYDQGFQVIGLFPVSSIGIVTSRDEFIIDRDEEILTKRVQDFIMSDSTQIARNKFGLRDTSKWKAEDARKHAFEKNNILPISYRPFDNRYIYYHNDFIERPRLEVMKNFLRKDNLGLLIKRQSKQDFSYVFVTNNLAESCIFESAYANNTVCPLYIYSEDGSKRPNLKKEIVDEIEKIGVKASPEGVFDYIYAFLYSPSYREKYKEFLKIDFPRVPYPNSKDQFTTLVVLGNELRDLHLLKSPKVNKFITSYPKEGSNIVDKVEYKDVNVYINKEQYFGKVTAVAWNFWIGGYQPAQKWLKDRKGLVLTNEDIEHYQKIIVALVETDRIMKEIDNVISI